MSARKFNNNPGKPFPKVAMSVHQRLGEKLPNTEMMRRCLDNDFNNEWNDRRMWSANANNSVRPGPGSGLLSEPQNLRGPPPPQNVRAAPPPPNNLNWDSAFKGNCSEIVGITHRNMSASYEDISDFEDQPLNRREFNNNVYDEPEHFAPNDFQRGMEEEVLNIRNYRETDSQFCSFDMEPRREKAAISLGSYHSFESGRVEASSTYIARSQDEGMVPDGQNNDQWRPYDEPIAAAKKRRREPSPSGPVPPRAHHQISDRIFVIGGYKLPYIRNGGDPLPQPESKSYAVRFFRKTPPFRIFPKKSNERPFVEHVYIETFDILDFDDTEGRLSLFRFRDDIADEWTKVYRGRMYRNWDGWWKDFHSINVDIDMELSKFEGFNVKYNFMPPPGNFNFPELIKRANIAMAMNRNNYLGNMRVIYGIMNTSILGNMNMETLARLQGIIRCVPNHLWIYKLRCMIYLWYNYSQVIKNGNTKDKKYEMVLKEWNSPVIHWVAKQALIDLRNISQVEYPEFTKLYGKSKKT